MGRIVKFLVILLLLLAAGTGLVFAPVSFLPPPELKSGDLIFQTSRAEHALGVMAGTMSVYNHVGIVALRNNKPYVLDSSGVVGYTALEKWLGRGFGERYAVYRAKLTDEQRQVLLDTASHYEGRKYDIYFIFDNNKLYCSELPYLVFKEIGMPIGKVQHVRDLLVNNPFTQSLIEDRWQTHPHCQMPGITFDQCYQIILDQDLVTPISLARDKHMTKIYSNYLGGLL